MHDPATRAAPPFPLPDRATSPRALQVPGALVAGRVRRAIAALVTGRVRRAVGALVAGRVRRAAGALVAGRVRRAVDALVTGRVRRAAGALVATFALFAPVACADAPGSGDLRPPASGSAQDGATATDRGSASPEARDPWERARRQGAQFRAIGQEPGWVFETYPQDSLRLLADYGELEVVAPWVVPARDEAGATTWTASSDGHTFFVVVSDVPCTDVMSGDSFPQAVIVVLDGRELHGCGRRLRE